MISVARRATTSQSAAAQNGGHHRVPATWHLGTSILSITPRLAYFRILKERLLVGLHPGRKLEPHQCHQDSGAHRPAGDEPGDRRVASGDGGEQARGRAGQDCGDHADHSGGRPEDWPVPAAQAQEGKPPRWRDAGQVASQFGREVEVVGSEPRDPVGVMKLFDPGLEHAVEGDEANE